VERARARGNDAARLERRHQPARARKQVVDDPLVVLHRGALRHGQRDHSGPVEGEAIERQHAGAHPDRGVRLLDDGELFADDLRGQGEPLSDPLQLALATLPVDAQKDDRAEGEEEDVPAPFERGVQPVRTDHRPGERRKRFLERDVLDESDGVKAMSRHPRRETATSFC
jgi:hypothetical protein